MSQFLIILITYVKFEMALPLKVEDKWFYWAELYALEQIMHENVALIDDQR